MIKTAIILDGKSLADKYLEKISAAVSDLAKKGVTLTLGTVRVGESKDTLLYAKAIENLFAKLHIRCKSRIFPDKISETDLCKQILNLSADPEITGILVFSPLPKSINPISVLTAMDFLKDVEGRRVFHSVGQRVMPPTAMACLALIEETGCEMAGKEAVVIGRSEVVGKPTALLLIDKGATVTVCHSKTKDLQKHVESADIVVATVGKPGLIKGDWIKPGAIVIDVGENVVNGKLVGDVEFEAAYHQAGFISPVPGGVGPVTNAMLAKNLLTLYQLKENLSGNR